MSINEMQYAVGKSIGQLQSAVAALIADGFQPVAAAPAFVNNLFAQAMVKESGLVNITAASAAILNSYAGKTIALNLAAGQAITLPAATGSGDKFRFVVGTTITGTTTIKVPSAAAIMAGTALLFADAGDTVVGFATAADTDTVTLTGDTTGGLVGAEVVLTDIAANLWHVSVVSDASGSEASPFSATVS